MRFCAWLLLAVLGAATLGEAVAPFRAPLLEVVRLNALEAQLVDPATREGPVGTSTVRLRTTSDHYALGGHIAVDAEGGLLFATMPDRDGPIPLGPGDANCSGSSDADGRWSCRIPFRFDGGGQIDFLAASGAPTILRFEPVVVKASPLAATGLGSLLILFAILSVAALLQLALPRRISAAARSRWLAGFGAVWLISSGIAGALVLGAFLVTLYLLLRSQIRAPGSRARLATALGFVVIVLLLARLAIPWSWRAFANPGSLSLAIPLGFAFMVIRAADLVLRVATREVRELAAGEYVAYMLFPATLAAGPIMTLPQFTSAPIERPGVIDWSAGAARIGIGLGKKMLADILLARIAAPRLALLYANGAATDPESLSILLLANALYVYLDFSAYSDIAIGVGRQLGWRVPENFDFPLLRVNMRAFWQSWHMTLSGWVSRWIHFFCAFNLRQAPAALRSGIPVIASLLIIGLWHEIQWSWLLWGMHHALGILLGDAWRAGLERWAPRIRTIAAPVFRAGGVLFVWSWLALSQCFTLLSDPALALAAYARVLTPWAP